MRSVLQRIEALMIVACVFLAATTCVCMTVFGEPATSADSGDSGEDSEIYELERKIIISFDNEDAKPDTQELLDELSAIDLVQGELWTRIVEYWHYANEEMEVYEEQLPDDLPKDDTLCIVVLGFELNDDGTMQDELLGRLETALHCAEQYPNAYVVCTGGGTARNNPDVTEAGLMGEWLIKHGLDEDRLIIENASRTTAQNALFSYDILLNKYPQVSQVAIVSSLYHIAWGSLLFEASFLKTAAEHDTPEIHVVSNCAYPILNEKYADTLRFEKGGMMQLVGDDKAAMDYYMGK